MPQGVSLEAQDLIGRLLQKVRGTPWPYPVWGIPLFCMHKLIYSFMCVIQLMIVCCTHTQVCVCMFAVIVYFLVHLLQNPKHRLKLQDILNHPFTRGATMTSYMSLTGGNNVRSTLLCTFTARSRPSVMDGYICTCFGNTQRVIIHIFRLNYVASMRVSRCRSWSAAACT